MRGCRVEEGKSQTAEKEGQKGRRHGPIDAAVAPSRPGATVLPSVESRNFLFLRTYSLTRNWYAQTSELPDNSALERGARCSALCSSTVVRAESVVDRTIRDAPEHTPDLLRRAECFSATVWLKHGVLPASSTLCGLAKSRPASLFERFPPWAPHNRLSRCPAPSPPEASCGSFCVTDWRACALRLGATSVLACCCPCLCCRRSAARISE